MVCNNRDKNDQKLKSHAENEEEDGFVKKSFFFSFVKKSGFSKNDLRRSRLKMMKNKQCIHFNHMWLQLVKHNK